MLIAGRISQISTDTGGNEVEAIRGTVRETHRKRAEERARLLPAGSVLHRPKHGHRIVSGPHRHAWFRVAIVNCPFGLDLSWESRREEIIEFAHGTDPLNGKPDGTPVCPVAAARG